MYFDENMGIQDSDLKSCNTVWDKKEKEGNQLCVVYVCKMHSQVLSFTKRNITESGLEVKKQVSTNILGSEDKSR